MQRSLVLTVLGGDRRGLVRMLAGIVAELGGNWVESRLVRLGGKFAGVVRVELASEASDDLQRRLSSLQEVGLRVWVDDADEPVGDAPAWRWAKLDLTGADHTGIVRDVTDVLTAAGVNVEELTTGVEPAPWSGEPLFRAQARLGLPPELELPDLLRRLEDVAADLMVDIQVVQQS